MKNNFKKKNSASLIGTEGELVHVLVLNFYEYTALYTRVFVLCLHVSPTLDIESQMVATMSC